MQKQHKYKNGIINYSIQGKGNTLVLLHGFLGSLRVWDELATPLSQQFQIICIDLPGHGKSSVFSDIHTMDFMAQCVHEVLEKEHIASYVIIGHSMGGYVTLSFAEMFPQRLVGIGLFHSHAAADSDQKKKDRNQVIRIVGHRTELVIAEMIPKLFAKEDISPYPIEHKKLNNIALEMSTEGLIAALAGMRDRYDKQYVLVNSNIPVLFILGKLDPVINFEEVKSQLELSDYIVPVILPTAGHMGFVEDFEASLFAIQEFTKSCYELA